MPPSRICAPTTPFGCPFEWVEWGPFAWLDMSVHCCDFHRPDHEGSHVCSCGTEHEEYEEDPDA